MTARTGAGYRKVDHLHGEDKGAENPHQGNLAIVEFRLYPPAATGDNAGAGGPHRPADGGGQQSIGHMHD